MLKFKKILTPMVVSLSLTFAPTAFADKNHHPRKNEMRQLLKQLDLSQAQAQDVRQLMKQGHDDHEVYRQDLREISNQLTALLHTSAWDQQAIQTVLLQGMELKSQIAWQKASKKNQVWQLLTPEQQSEFVLLTEQEKNKKHKRKNSFRFLKTLDLSDQQIIEIDSFKAEFEIATKHYKVQHQAFKAAQQSLIRSADLSESDWHALDLKHKEDKLGMALAKAQHRHNIWNVLDVAQQSQLVEKAQHRTKKRHSQSHNVERS